MGKPRLKHGGPPLPARAARAPHPAFPLAQVRAYWARCQGITARTASGVTEIVRDSGWLYSSGGAGAYLSVRARNIGRARVELDNSVFRDKTLIEAPAVRGCTMLVPVEDLPFAIYGAHEFFKEHSAKVAACCKISDREIRDLTAALSAILGAGPQSSESLKSLVPKSLVRPLGEAGRKFGENWNLDFVLKKLRMEGLVQRISTEGRLDRSRFSYRMFEPPVRIDLTAKEACRELARRFFRWAAPATLREFAWWAGVSQRNAKISIEQLGLQTIRVTETGLEALIQEDRITDLEASAPEDSIDRLTFIPFRDNYLYFRRGMSSFINPDDCGIETLDFRNKMTPLGAQDTLHHNGILFEGRLVGAWEFDPEQDRLVWKTWREWKGLRKKSLLSQAEELEHFIRTELGDAAFYSFDHGKKRRERISSLG